MASSENKHFRKNTWKNIMFLPHFLTLRIWQEHTEKGQSQRETSRGDSSSWVRWCSFPSAKKLYILLLKKHRRERKREISAFDQSLANPVVRALLRAVWIHSFDLFFVSSHANRRARNSSPLQREASHVIHVPLERALQLYATAGGLKGEPVIPFVLHRFQQTVDFRWN